ncbi:ATP-binding cassette domain-containing protein [Methylobacterium brachythecii]|uniref:ABC transporter ATP-binding protein n=1 Tax=Methylobacterium brachythecii TaxID=1176177 RepID=A0A7W6AJ84_9HYPH|nr:ABC transporter ATP-binding protein [Methylobacterium brachythecii]MBB3903688.1 ABC-type glutathione transport system ATPase component [Methylobacterium brachythecii]GLS44259.1 ABC transporter ATP-binding protein [Methylobacterium brachythecii]
MAPERSPLLEVEDLTIAFGDGAPVLDGLNFALNRNEIVGLVGETGAGKSILTRAIIDLLPKGGAITAGDIRVEGQSVGKLPEARKRALRGGEVALIGTNAKLLLDPVATVGSQVGRVLKAHRPASRTEIRSRVIDVFRQVGIVNPEARYEAFPHELSGGMAQRVVIAMALIAEPKLILADDATLGLDATIQAQVLDLLVSKGRELGLGVLLITHDLGIISHYCDRVGIIQGGRLIELKPVDQFLDKPETEYSRLLLDAAKVRPAPRDQSGDDAPAASIQPLLDVKELRKTFVVDGGQAVVRAVDGISFRLCKGETLALVGESGSGKTTAGQCLLKLLQADSGSVMFDGTEILGLREHEFRRMRRRLQVVFQEPYVALNPRWQVVDLISEPLALTGQRGGAERAAEVTRLIDLVHLPRRVAGLYPHQLTAGEQKRVGIARALATGPDFVVFDEPTTALDIRVRAQIIDLVRELQARMGLSALFITHDLNSVRSLAHNVAVMRHGKIVEHGETEQIFARPKEAYTRMLLAAELPIEANRSGKAPKTELEFVR